MLNLNPYLHFKGNAADAMNFYRAVFNSEFTIYQKYGDTAGAEKMSAGDQEKIIHISLPIGKSNSVIMATDMLDAMNPSLTIGNNFHICINAESEAEVDRLFKDLSAEGSIGMPINRTLWGAYFGMCKDKFAIQWMISYDPKMETL